MTTDTKEVNREQLTKEYLEMLTDKNRCQACGGRGETKEIKLYKNLGLLIIRQHRTLQGRLCRRCIRKQFQSFMLYTLIFGWWGIVSFFVNIVYIALNFRALFKSFGMDEAEPVTNH